MFRVSMLAGHFAAPPHVAPPTPPPDPPRPPGPVIITEDPRPQPTQGDLEDALLSDPLTRKQMLEFMRSKV